MPYRVEVPGQAVVEFPDDVSLDDARKAIITRFYDSPLLQPSFADRQNVPSTKFNEPPSPTPIPGPIDKTLEQLEKEKASKPEIFVSPTTVQTKRESVTGTETETIPWDFQMMPILPLPEGTDASTGLGRAAVNLWNGLQEPSSVLAIGGLPQRAVAGFFTYQAVKNIPDAVVAFSKAQTPAEKTEAGANIVLSMLTTALGLKGATLPPGVKMSDLIPKVQETDAFKEFKSASEQAAKPPVERLAPATAEALKEQGIQPETPKPTEPISPVAQGSTPSQIETKPGVTAGEASSVGAAAAGSTEFGRATIGELIQPELREGVAKLSEPQDAMPETQGFLSKSKDFLTGLKETNISEPIRGWLGTIAGKSLPKITIKDRVSGELGARQAASRAASAPMGDVFANDVLAGLNVDQSKFHAALLADNLLDIKASFEDQALKAEEKGSHQEALDLIAQADNVNTLIGTERFPFKSESELVEYFKDPQVSEALKRHKENWNAVIEPMYKEAAGIDPETELPTRGKYTGARLNLNPILPGEYEPSNGVKVGVAPSGNLLGTIRRKTPFARKAYGTGQAYVLNYAESIANSFSKQLEIANKRAFDDQLVKSGNAVVSEPGKRITLKDGESTKAYPFKRAGFQNKNIYVRASLSKEYAIVNDVVLNPYKGSLIVGANRAFAQAALAGLTDATVHIENLGTALFQVPGATGTPLLVDSLLSGLGRLDLPVIMAKAGIKAAPEIGRTRIYKALEKYLPSAIVNAVNKGMLRNLTQFASISEINAARASFHRRSIPGMKQLGQSVAVADKVTRMVLDDTYRNLVKEGLVKDTETNRREFINQAGNYNLRTQGPWMRLLRQTVTSPFITAGRNFATLGVRAISLNPGVEASGIKTAAALRANMLSKWVGSVVFVATMNYLLVGKLKGRPGVPFGNIDTGMDDKNGEPLSFNALAFTGQARALRTVGAKGVIQSTALGLGPTDAAESAVRDIANTGLSALAGPGARFASVALTGYPPAKGVGRESRVAAPGESQTMENIKAAALQANPILASIHEATKPGGEVSKAVARQLPRFTLSPGKPPPMVERYPKIVQMAQAKEFIEDVIHVARSVPFNKRYDWVIEQVQRLPPEEQKHAMQEIRRRRVFSR